MPPSAPGARRRPTAALLRAAIVGCAAMALAVLVGKPALILAGLPLLVWALVALALRLVAPPEQESAPPRIQASRRTLEEGGSAIISLATAPGVLTAATFPMRPQTDFAPRYGSTAGDGHLQLRLSAQRWGRVRVGPVHVLVTDQLGAFRDQLE
ncbi:MAG: DUF58 domain-containing protein, partial [Brachybacterium sp.]